MDEEEDNSKLYNDYVYVLLVDDEEYLVKLWKHVLERKGYRVTSYINGLQAIEHFRAKPGNFNIVITDQSMPDITGFELAVEILKIRSDIKIIICSGFLGDIDINDVVNLKIDDVLLKPFDSNTLLAAIEKVLFQSKV